jgi:hypothetical protein
MTLRSGRVLLHLLVAAWNVGVGVMAFILDGPRPFGLLMLIGGMTTAIGMLRLACLQVVLHHDHLEVHNLLRTFRVPWSQIQDVDLAELNQPFGWAMPALPRTVKILVNGRWRRVQALTAKPIMLNGLAVVGAHPPRWLCDAYGRLHDEWQRSGGRSRPLATETR